MQEVKLNFINRSQDNNDSQILIFQKNTAEHFDEQSVAWMVIKNCKPGDNHPFNFPLHCTISASDSLGNETNRVKADNGQLFELKNTQSGPALVLTEEDVWPQEIHLMNSLPKGAMTANIYRNNRLLGIKTGMVPGQKTSFKFNTTLWIGAVSLIDEGVIINSAIVSDITTRINLYGIASADLVMTGGGPGRSAVPFSFGLENIKHS